MMNSENDNEERNNENNIQKAESQKLKGQSGVDEKEIISEKEEGFNLLLKGSLKNYEPLSESDKEIIFKSIESNRKKAEYSQEIAERIFEKIEQMSEKELRVTATVVPKGILPPDYSCTLHDVRISPVGPGEKIYNKNKWIRKNITRGLNFMQLSGKEGRKFDFAIYANKKFAGGKGDEDDNYQSESKDTWKKFFIDSVEKANVVIFMKKLDGFAGHFSIRKIEGEYFIIAGSKNVHLLIRTRDDIEKYKEGKFTIAKKVAEGVLNTFDEMDESKSFLLKHHLNITKETVVCELLDPQIKQHLVDSSHLKKATIFGLMLTSTPGMEKVKSLTTMTPQICLKYFEFFGISTPENFVVAAKCVKNTIAELRTETDYEGCVLYYLINDRTIGLLKVKTIWYVIMRVLREKDIFQTSKNGELKKSFPDMIEASKSRIDEIHDWLEISEAYLNEWKKLVESFINWLDKKIKAKKIQPVNIRPKFHATWKEFAKEKNVEVIDNNNIINNITWMFRSWWI